MIPPRSVLRAVAVLGAWLSLSAQMRAAEKAALVAEIQAAYLNYVSLHLQDVTLKAVERKYNNGKLTGESGIVFKAGHGRSIVRWLDVASDRPGKSAWLNTLGRIYHIQESKKDPGKFVLDGDLKKTDKSIFSIYRSETGILLPFSLFEISTFDLIALPDFEVVTKTSDTWKGHEVVKVVGTRPLRGGVEESLYFDAREPWFLRANVTRSIKKIRSWRRTRSNTVKP